MTKRCTLWIILGFLILATAIAAKDYTTGNFKGILEAQLAPTGSGAEVIRSADVDDTVVDGATFVPPSSNWAYDHNLSGESHPTVTYNPVSLDVDSGTLDSGTFTDLTDIRVNFVSISETTGAGPLTARVGFSGVGVVNQVLIRAYYAGGALHNVQMEIFNYTDAVYEKLGILVTDSDYGWHAFPLFNYTDYLSAGVAIVRFRHLENGNASHDLNLDYVVLNHATSGGGGISDHGELVGLDHDDHPQYPLKVGTTIDTQIGVWTGDGTIEGDPNLVWDGSSLAAINASGIINMLASVSGTATLAAHSSSSDAGQVSLRALGSTVAGTFFGATAASSALIFTANLNRMLIGTTNAVSLILGTNDTAAVTIDSSQNVTVNAGNLDVPAGNITVSGTVDGIDVSVDVGANNTHRTSTGADHGYLDQAVTAAASPAFAGLSVAPDTDVSVTIGRAVVGDASATTDFAAFSHVDWATAVAYALRQSASGNTFLNCKTGSNILFRENNVTIATMTASGLDISLGTLDVSADTDITATIGRAVVGNAAATADSASFSHVDQTGTTNYALRQGSTGNTFLNCPTGLSVFIRENDVNVMKISGTNVGIGTATQDRRLDVVDSNAAEGTIQATNSNGGASAYAIETHSGTLDGTNDQDFMEINDAGGVQRAFAFWDSGGGGIRAASSRLVKKDITTVTLSNDDRFLQTPLQSFRYIDMESTDPKVNGWVADSLAVHFPHAIGTMKMNPSTAAHYRKFGLPNDVTYLDGRTDTKMIPDMFDQIRSLTFHKKQANKRLRHLKNAGTSMKVEIQALKEGRSDWQMDVYLLNARVVDVEETNTFLQEQITALIAAGVARDARLTALEGN